MKFKKSPHLMTILILSLTLVLLLHSSQIVASGEKALPCCQGITLKNAATFLGVSPDDLQRSSRLLMVSPDDTKRKTYKFLPCSCSIRSKANFMKTISYTTYVYNNSKKARMDFDRMKNNFATVSKINIVKGLNGEVFRVGDKRFHRMVALKDAVLIDVLNPNDCKIQKQILRLLLHEDR